MPRKIDRVKLGDVIVDFGWATERNGISLTSRHSGAVVELRNTPDCEFIYRDEKSGLSHVGFSPLLSCFHTDASGVRYWTRPNINIFANSDKNLGEIEAAEKEK